MPVSVCGRRDAWGAQTPLIRCQPRRVSTVAVHGTRHRRADLVIEPTLLEWTTPHAPTTAPRRRSFLNEAADCASRLGRDANAMWTAFGPTNVAIHRMTAAMELGDVQIAVDLAPRIDASALPLERRVRHAIETARAYTARNRRDDALRGRP